MTNLDVAQAVAKINSHIRSLGFRPDGADLNDFRYGTDPGLRFKTGTVYGEVTVTVWRYRTQTRAIRCTTDAAVQQAIDEITQYTDEYFEKRRVNHG